MNTTQRLRNEWLRTLEGMVAAGNFPSGWAGVALQLIGDVAELTDALSDYQCNGFDAQLCFDHACKFAKHDSCDGRNYDGCLLNSGTTKGPDAK